MRHLLFVLLFTLPTCAIASAQALPASVSDDADPAAVTGPNVSLSNEGQNNSATGWSDVLTPSASWRFNAHFAFSADFPIYTYASAYVQPNGLAAPVLQSKKFLPGDASFSGTAAADFFEFHDEATGTIGLATGNQKFGLGAGTTTWNVTNHIDRSLGIFTPAIEFGFGNSSSLDGGAVRKSYVSVGKIANFQAGTSIDLPLRMSLDLEAYEDLPVSTQSVYGTVTRKARNGKTTTVVQGTGSSEDNGFTAEFDLPVGTHFKFATTYEHSLIQDLDTYSFGLTWTLRTPKAQ